MFLDVTVISNTRILYRGQARRVILPGDSGVFEILSFHKRALSRLLEGIVEIDDQSFPILRGIAKVEKNNVTIAIEQASNG